MIKVSVVIASWNRRKDTVETMQSLSKSNLKGIKLEVVVVDNGSKDDSVKEIKKFIRTNGGKTPIQWILIENETNLGFCEGNNVGMRHSLKKGNDYVMLLNDDVITDKNLVRRMVDTSERYKENAVVTPKIYFAPGFEYHKKYYKKSEIGKVFWYAGGDIDWDNVYCTNHGVDEVDKGQYEKEREIDFASGCCVLFPRKILEKVGLLDKRFFAYLEDADISQRVKKEGYKVIYTPKGILWHKVSQSSGIGSDLNDYFITRNRMIFGMRYAKPRTKFALFRESLKLLAFGRKWQKVGIRDFYIKKYEKGSWK